MALQLNQKKDGEAIPKLQLKLAKPARFSVELYWDSSEDLDGHALLAANNGDGAKVDSPDKVLSTFNPSLLLADGSSSTRKVGDKRPFMTPCRSLHHSGDARTGVGASVDEIITIDGALIPDGVNEIPIFVTIYPGGAGTFSQVKQAGIRIKNDRGVVLGEYALSNQFGQFDAVQMGSLLLGPNGWEYAAAGSGFNGDFNTILEHFS